MEPLLRFYTTLLRANGSKSPRSLGWRDEHSQLSRFAILTDVGALSGASVLDEGCGLGDLYPYLRERFADIRYTGIDVNSEVIEEASRKYPEATFEAVDFTDYRHEPFDYVLSSGALTFKVPDHRAFYYNHIEKMFALAKNGIAFNMLDSARSEEDATYATYDAGEVYHFCRSLTGTLTLRHDYSDEDFTFYLYH